MTKFEQIGINRLYDAINKEEAIKTFSRSCEICCTKGVHIQCDHCAIAATYNMIIAYFDDVEASKRGNKQVDEQKEVAK